MKGRLLQNWIYSYEEYTKAIKLEAPDSYHLWTAISSIASALERKVWYCQIPTKPIYANQYIVLVGPPGRCRKGGAMSCGEYFTGGLKPAINMCADGSSRKGIIRAMLRSTVSGKDLYTHSSISAISKELGVLLNRSESMFMESLNDWWDCGNSRGEWSHETEKSGIEKVEGVWFNLLGATVPPGYSKALSPDIIGSGFAARSLFIFEKNRRWSYGRKVKLTEKMKVVQNQLIYDLNTIHKLYGEYEIEPEAEDYYVNWYEPMENTPGTPQYVQEYIERIHSHVLKVAMVLAAAKRNELVIKLEDVECAREMLEGLVPGLIEMFRSVGRNLNAKDTIQILKQIEHAGKDGIGKVKLLRDNRGELDGATLKTIVDDLVAADEISRDISSDGRELYKRRRS